MGDGEEQQDVPVKCSRCKAMAVPGRVCCQKHLDYDRVRSHIRFEQHKAEGICVQCNSKPAVPGKQHCSDCAVEAVARAAAWRLENPGQRNTTELLRREQRRAAGLCTICPLPSDGHATCPTCRAKRLAERMQLIAAGICTSCRRDPADSGTNCAPCLQKRREALREVHRRRLAAGRCVTCNKEPLKVGFKRCQPCLTRRQMEAVRLRFAAFVAYGGAICACCGATDIEFLHIDHIGGGGNAHRKRSGTRGVIYWWLKRNHYPPGFRVLCAGCNLAMGFYGYCPHQRFDPDQSTACGASSG